MLLASPLPSASVEETSFGVKAEGRSREQSLELDDSRLAITAGSMKSPKCSESVCSELSTGSSKLLHSSVSSIRTEWKSSIVSPALARSLGAPTAELDKRDLISAMLLAATGCYCPQRHCGDPAVVGAPSPPTPHPRPDAKKRRICCSETLARGFSHLNIYLVVFWDI